MAKSSTSFEQDNQSATKHGLEANVKRLQHGQPLTGPAAEAEAIVRAELETEGVTEIVKTGAIRLESVARGFYNQLTEAMAKGDMAAIDKLVKRYGWLQMGALRAWAQVEAMGKNGDDGSIEAALTSARQGRE